jgi:DNA-binding transcriptional MerR regulator
MSINYSISEVSERLNLSYRTLHHWESKFDLQINRDSTGNRLYSENDVEILEYIVELKNKGLTLDGIKRLLYDKGIIEKVEYPTVVVPVSDQPCMSLDALKSILTDEIRQAMELHYHDMNSKLERVLEENERLHDELKRSEEDRQALHEELTRIIGQNRRALQEINNNLLELSNRQPFWKRLLGGKK